VGWFGFAFIFIYLIFIGTTYSSKLCLCFRCPHSEICKGPVTPPRQVVDAVGGRICGPRSVCCLSGLGLWC